MQGQAKSVRGQGSVLRTTRVPKAKKPTRTKSKKTRNVMSWADVYQYTIPQWNGCRGQGHSLPEAY